MELQKVLIADGMEEFRAGLEKALGESYEVFSCGDGVEALRALGSFCPDLLVLDLMLPGMDGISLLQTAAAMGYAPKVLATSRFLSPYVLDAVNRLGVSYVIQKPCDIRATAARIGDLLDSSLPMMEVTEPEPRTEVSNILLALNVPTKLHGYSYLREAVLLVLEKPNQSVTKELYPAVGAVFNVSQDQVERCIRTAIRAAWDCREEKIWRTYFQPGQGGQLSRPSNAAFISGLANAVALRRRKAGA